MNMEGGTVEIIFDARTEGLERGINSAQSSIEKLKEGAQNLGTKIAESFDGGGKTTSLLFGIQYDLMLRYISPNNSPDVTNSTSWGNHLDSTISIGSEGELRSKAKAATSSPWSNLPIIYGFIEMSDFEVIL